MRFTAKVGLTLTLVIAASTQLWATENVSENTVIAGVQSSNVDGNTSKFLEDSWGEQSGLFLDQLVYSSSGDLINLNLDARFTTGSNGWFDFEVTGDNWSGGLKTTLVSHWSNTSFASGFLPSGTPVGSLYPGTTTLDPVFGISEPSTETLTGEAWLTYRFSRFNRITLRTGTRSRDGERVPNVGGFSFSDVGTAAFYTSGLETLDSSSSWLELQGVFAAGPIDLRIEGGVLNVDSSRRVRLPAYGQGSLLDLNEWRDGIDSDTSWLAANASWDMEKLGFYGALFYADTSAVPYGGDSRIDESGLPVRDGLAISDGSLDVEIFAAALGVAWKIADSLTFTATFDTRSREGDGGIDLSLRNAPITPTLAAYEEDRVGGTMQVKFETTPFWARLRARGTSTDLDRSEERGQFSQATERRTDRIDVRLDSSVRLADAWDLSAWLRYDDSDIDVELGDLWQGYASGDWSKTSTSGALTLRYRSDGIQASVSATTGSLDIDSDVPWYDPIFDPSVDLLPVTADQNSTRVTGSLLWPLAKGSFWIEAGWLEVEYDMLTAPVTLGFAPIAETVSGAVVALGADFGMWKGGTLGAHFEWVDNKDDLDSEILRGQLQIGHELNSRFTLFGRWAYWDLHNNLAPNDAYEVNILAAGVQVRF